MIYHELLRKFWDFNKKKTLGISAIALYLFLLEIWIETKEESFKVSDTLICRNLGIARNTIKPAKEKLRTLGLIQYKFKKGMSTYYRLVLDYSSLLPTSDEKEKPLSKKEIVPLLEKMMGTKVIQNYQLKQPIQQNQSNQLIQNKTTKISPQETPIKIENQRFKNKNIPSLEEFMEFAKTLGIYEERLDLSIQSKYKNWVDNDWKNSYNRPVTNWKSSLKSTLPYLKNASTVNKTTLKSIPNIKRPKLTKEE